MHRLFNIPNLPWVYQVTDYEEIPDIESQMEKLYIVDDFPGWQMWVVRFQGELCKFAKCYCADCGTPSPNLFMVHKVLWNLHGNGKGILCRHCFSKRMGRPVVREDLTDAPINYIWQENNL